MLTSPTSGSSKMTNFQLEFAHQLFVLPIERLEERRGACVRCHRRLEICAGSFNPCLETDGDNQQLPPVRRRGVPTRSGGRLGVTIRRHVATGPHAVGETGATFNLRLSLAQELPSIRALRRRGPRNPLSEWISRSVARRVHPLRGRRARARRCACRSPRLRHRRHALSCRSRRRR